MDDSPGLRRGLAGAKGGRPKRHQGPGRLGSCSSGIKRQEYNLHVRGAARAPCRGWQSDASLLFKDEFCVHQGSKNRRPSCGASDMGERAEWAALRGSWDQGERTGCTCCFCEVRRTEDVASLCARPELLGGRGGGSTASAGSPRGICSSTLTIWSLRWPTSSQVQWGREWSRPA